MRPLPVAAPDAGMLISHRKRFIYTKTVKTASTSVEVYFQRWCLPPGEWISPGEEPVERVSDHGIVGIRAPRASGHTWYNHMPAAQIREQIGEETWNAYFKFCVVRNPFSRLVSLFYFTQRDDPGVKRDPVAAFRDWVAEGRYGDDRARYTIDGELCLDYYIRQESLAPGVMHVCHVLGIPWEPARLPQLKARFRPRHIPLADYYDDATRQRVEDRFAFELETFAYLPPGA